MANNIVGASYGVPNGLIAKSTIDCVAVFTSSEVTIVYELGGVLKSWVPGRPINSLTQFTKGKTYYINALQNMDKTAYFYPPVESTKLAKSNLILFGAGANAINCKWNAVPNGFNYTLERATNDAFTQGLTTVYVGEEYAFVDTGLIQNTMYYYRLKVAGDNFEDSDYDYENLTTTLPATSGFRFASNDDVAAIDNASLGDYIIDGPNVDGSVIAGVFETMTLGPGQKILLKGGAYASIYISMANCSATSNNPIVITNYDGQVVAALGVEFAKFVRVTGKYDPVAKTGDPAYLGWESDWTTTGILTGKFGFLCSAGYANSGSSHITFSGGGSSDIEIDYLEGGMGGYAGIMMKADNYGIFDFENCKIHDCYIHDCGGEGMYLGNTSGDPQHQMKNLKVYNNLVARAGLNGIQAGQLRDDCEIYNNTVICAAFSWSNPFMSFQDQTLQLQCRNGGAHIYNNLFIGGGESFINFFLRPRDVVPANATPILIQNNAFLYIRGSYFAYMNSNAGVTMNVEYLDNVIGKHNMKYVDGYPGTFSTTSEIISEAYSSSVTITADNNITDSSNSGGGPFIVETGDQNSQVTINGTGNVRQATVPDVEFKNFMGLPMGTDFANIENWTGTWNTSTMVGQPRLYALNQYVVYKGKMYKSKVANNAQNEPPAVASDANWELLTFGGGTVIPDDCRLKAGNYYALRGIGMTRTYA